MKSLFKKIVAALVAFAVSTAASAVGCSGAVSFVALDSSGAVYGAVEGTAINIICNTKTQGSFLVDPATCKTMYSVLVATKLTAKQMVMYYNSVSSCGSITSYSTQPSFYFLEGPY